MDGEQIWRDKTAFDDMEKVVFKVENERLEDKHLRADNPECDCEICKKADKDKESDDYDYRTHESI